MVFFYIDGYLDTNPATEIDSIIYNTRHSYRLKIEHFKRNIQRASMSLNIDSNFDVKNVSCSRNAAFGFILGLCITNIKWPGQCRHIL